MVIREEIQVMNFKETNLKIYLVLLLIVPWLKGGNDKSSILYAVLICFLICILKSLSELKFRKTYSDLKFRFVLLFLLICCFSLFQNYLNIIRLEDLQNDLKPSNLSLESERSAFFKILSDVKDSGEVTLDNYLLLNTNNELDYKFSKLSNEANKIIDKLFYLISEKFVPYVPNIPFWNDSLFLDLAVLCIVLASSVLLVANIHSIKYCKIVSIFILLNCFILAFVGVLQKFNILNFDLSKPLLGIWSVSDPRYYFSTFSYKNHWSGFVILCLFHGMAVLLSKNQLFRRNRKSYFRVFLIFLFLLPLATLFVIESRLALFILFVSCVSLGLFFKFRLSLKISALVLSVAMCLGFLMLPKESSVWDRTNSQIENLKQGKYPFRFLLWQDAVNQIQERSFWGYGIGSYKIINPIFQSSETVHERYVVTENAHRSFTPIIKSTHNDLLQFIIEHGFISCCLILFPVFFVSLREFIYAKSNYLRIIAAGCLMYLLHSFLDLPNSSFANLILFSTTFAIILACRRIRMS